MNMKPNFFVFLSKLASLIWALSRTTFASTESRAWKEAKREAKTLGNYQKRGEDCPLVSLPHAS